MAEISGRRKHRSLFADKTRSISTRRGRNPMQPGSIQESEIVWAKIPGMKILWPAKLVKIHKKDYVVYVKSDNENFYLKKSEASLMPFIDHISVLKTEGLEYFISHKMLKYKKLFLADIEWALEEIRSTCRDKSKNDRENVISFESSADKDSIIDDDKSIKQDCTISFENDSTITDFAKNERDNGIPFQNLAKSYSTIKENEQKETNPEIPFGCVPNKDSIIDNDNHEKDPKSLLRNEQNIFSTINENHVINAENSGQSDESISSIMNGNENQCINSEDLFESEANNSSNFSQNEQIERNADIQNESLTHNSSSIIENEKLENDLENTIKIVANVCSTSNENENHEISAENLFESVTFNRSTINENEQIKRNVDISFEVVENSCSIIKDTNKSDENGNDILFPCLANHGSISDDDRQVERVTDNSFESTASNASNITEKEGSFKAEDISFASVTSSGSAYSDYFSESISEWASETQEDDSMDETYKPCTDDGESDSDTSLSDLTPDDEKIRMQCTIPDGEQEVKSDSDSDSGSEELTLGNSKKARYNVDVGNDELIENSCSDGETSVIYPLLNQQVLINYHTENRSEDEGDTDEETLEEGSILQDKENPAIYITRVMKSRTTKSGKAKKHGRVYNSYQFCGTCGKKVSNLSQHLDRNSFIHDTNPKIKEIREESDKRRKKKLQTLLRGKFNHDFNMRTVERGKGEILLERRPTNDFRLKDYGPCPNCLLWFAKKLLNKHAKKCINKKVDSVSIGDITTQSDCLSGKLKSVASKRLVKEVFSKMQRDEVSSVVKGDLLLTQLGNQWLEKNVGNVLKRGVYTSQILRLMGRFLIILRKIKPLSNEAGSMWDYLKPCHFESVIQACILTASPLDDSLKSPSNAIKIGYDLKRLLNGKIGLSIIHNDLASQTDAEKMFKLITIYWGTKVTKAARVILLERSYYAKKNLPTPEDIKGLSNYLKQILTKFDYKLADRTNYREIAEAVQAKLIIYNRRRTGEVQAIRLRDYDRRCSGRDGSHLLGSCSELEKKLLESQEVMTIRGKVGRAVPVILPDDVKQGLKYLADTSVRASVGISSSNEYLFASEGDSIVWAYDSVRKAALSAQLENPEAITSTNLRKYMATVTQVLDLTDSQMQWVTNHLGHTMDVHKLHYRATSDILERTQIAKILLLQDQGRIGHFKNKTLDDINLEDIVFEEQPQTEMSEQRLPNVNEEDTNGFVSPDVVTETLNEAESFFGDENKPKGKLRKKPQITTKTYWTEEEEKEIRVRFKHFFTEKVRPKPSDCLKVILKSQRENGVLGKRRKDVLKKKVFRMIDKL